MKIHAIVLRMDFVHILILISLSISAVGASLYIRDMLRGTTKPNLVSYAMWASAPLIGAGAALSGGADAWATSRILMSGLVPAAVFITALCIRNGYWKLNTFDLMCGAFSLLALIVWLYVGSPVTAVLIAVLGDVAATIPTLIKGWKYPETETGKTYLLGLIGSLLALPAIPTWDIINASFQIYLVTANLALIFVVYRKRFM
jgi:hypothetical protein